MSKEMPIFLDCNEEAAMGLFLQIKENGKLNRLEIAGLGEGKRRGKSPHVSFEELHKALQKQWKDLEKACARTDQEWPMAVEKCLADLRNVAGILFLNVSGEKILDK